MQSGPEADVVRKAAVAVITLIRLLTSAVTPPLDARGGLRA